MELRSTQIRGGQLKPSNVVKTEPEITETNYSGYKTKAIFENIPQNSVCNLVNIVESPSRVFVSWQSVLIVDGKINKHNVSQGFMYEKVGGNYSTDYDGNRSSYSLSENGTLMIAPAYYYPFGGENVFTQYTKAVSYLIYQDY